MQSNIPETAQEMVEHLEALIEDGNGLREWFKQNELRIAEIEKREAAEDAAKDPWQRMRDNCPCCGSRPRRQKVTTNIGS